ncbi:MAG: type II toxin-antitoxin system PemK/MazF family toxin [Acidobacteria bacterium]|nr:type II toxin-antitoxin system PemK/MazF family toxin [Acidobacteriota bacterium]MBI3425853.1 type II toxin-antitoxin system PemK/MazF family toxin [Acidobacteriota bacterium]
MNFRRWEIWLAQLDPIRGSEQGKTRAVLVISRSTFNQIMPIVDVLPITSRKAGRTLYRNEALIPAGTSGLPNESIVMCH